MLILYLFSFTLSRPVMLIRQRNSSLLSRTFITILYPLLMSWSIRVYREAGSIVLGFSQAFAQKSRNTCSWTVFRVSSSLIPVKYQKILIPPKKRAAMTPMKPKPPSYSSSQSSIGYPSASVQFFLLVLDLLLQQLDDLRLEDLERELERDPPLCAQASPTRQTSARRSANATFLIANDIRYNNRLEVCKLTTNKQKISRVNTLQKIQKMSLSLVLARSEKSSRSEIKRAAISHPQLSKLTSTSAQCPLLLGPPSTRSRPAQHRSCECTQGILQYVRPRSFSFLVQGHKAAKDLHKYKYTIVSVHDYRLSQPPQALLHKSTLLRPYTRREYLLAVPSKVALVELRKIELPFV